jgi:predicted dehydrogenase
MKIAIVGCGKFADAHAEQIARMPELGRLVAVCDAEPLMAEQLAVRYGIGAHFSSFDAMLEQIRPDVVHVATPPATHLGLARRAFEAGAHVYVEKPLAPTLEAAQALVEAARAAGRRLTVGYTYLFDPPARRLRQLLGEGVLGEVVHVESFYGYDLDGPFGRAIMADPGHWVHGLPGGLLQNNIDHLLNKLVELLPSGPVEVEARGSRQRKTRYRDVRDRTCDELRLSLQVGGVSAYGTFSSHIRPAAHWCRVYGSRNTVLADYTGRSVTLAAGTRMPSALGRLGVPFEQALSYAAEGWRNAKAFARSDYQFFGGLEHLMRAFYRSILDRGEPPIPYDDMLRVSRIMAEIFAQLEQRRGTWPS